MNSRQPESDPIGRALKEDQSADEFRSVELDESNVDPRLTSAVAWYLERLEAGDKPNRKDLLARFPDLVDLLSTCLDGLDFMYQVVPQFREPTDGPADGATDGATDAPVKERLPNASLGDFQIIREVGAGGMGVVYEAEQISLGRRVALKVLPLAAMLDHRQLQRFKNESHAAAALQHQNIVPVYSVGCDRGVHYYAMQFIDGSTLADVIEELRNSDCGLRIAE